MLASLALDRRDERTSLALVEPDPPRVPSGLPGWVGGNAIRAGLLAKEAAEEEERIAPRFTAGSHRSPSGSASTSAGSPAFVIRYRHGR